MTRASDVRRLPQRPAWAARDIGAVLRLALVSPSSRPPESGLRRASPTPPLSRDLTHSSSPRPYRRSTVRAFSLSSTSFKTITSFNWSCLSTKEMASLSTRSTLHHSALLCNISINLSQSRIRPLNYASNLYGKSIAICFCRKQIDRKNELIVARMRIVCLHYTII